MKTTCTHTFSLLLTVALLGCNTGNDVKDQPSPNEPFFWPANTTLEATEEIIAILPGDLVDRNEIIDSVIQFSDEDTQIAFEPSGNNTFRSISLWLKAGTRVTLTKDAKVHFKTPGGKSKDGQSILKALDTP
jgi:hypothetical protein